MALVSPTNLLSLHHASGDQTTALNNCPSRRYRYANETNGEQPLKIPDPMLFLSPSTDHRPKVLPTISHCAIHLEMLEVFHTLRHEVIQSTNLDAAFDIGPRATTKSRRKWDSRTRKYIAEAVLIQDPNIGDKRKMKWTYFLHIAATRFHEWIRRVANHLKDAQLGAPLPRYLFLPPLDVLVIWHAFLLNCDDFKAYCEKNKLFGIQDIVFPWADIHAAIDPDTWKYTLPSEHSDWLLNTHGLDSNLVETLAHSGKKDTLIQNVLHAFYEPQKRSKQHSTSRLSQTLRKARQTQELNKPLVENVERQCVFVDKMHAHRWIRSPAVAGTLRRAVDRYGKFLHLFRLHPDQFLVPTLDVDLVWHTHQCSAGRYRTFVTERVGRFINHEDKIGRGTLDDGFTNAEQWYRLRYGEQYQVCLCWSCEAILEEVEELDDDEFGELDPQLGDLASRVERRVHYYREVEVARTLGREMPLWGHG
ncbi:uncharacterized protein DSM5745_06818 [Aspergillus mulundensis]|uniref:Uncharacterized protein n=1 Tax=Aspergillus mulundensis TaxID=1810919 RepID=A0A3D8RSA0_9EURO|nr:Uncharacterized protein DSM5745_06818 [Aspergillus mulundensis]RDW76826.1 Uncharacterized protein DSM5745_06818 [Aspergillus mulundensis]